MKRAVDEEMMNRCLSLAVRGRLFVAPNPMVGCIIVKDGKIVGEGYHKRFGGHHAEVYALKRAGAAAKGATLYVNLEPCAHFGKTPPCVNAIIAAGIKRVVAPTRDPNRLVSGRGFKTLRSAGIVVDVGTMKKEAELLNEKFISPMKSGRPYIALKIAQTLDGRIVDGAGKSKWITGEDTRRYVHQLRAEHQAVLVGAGTILKDDPELTVRLVRGRTPTRIVVDGSLRIPRQAAVFNTSVAPTVMLTRASSMRRKRTHVLHLENMGVQVLGIRARGELGAEVISDVLGLLGISSVLVEGGSRMFSRFLDEGLADKLYLFIAPKMFGKGLSALELRTGRTIESPIRVLDFSVKRMSDDLCIEGRIEETK